MRNLKSREIVEMVALHGLCTQDRTQVEGLPEAAKRVADVWAKLNPEICDKDAQ